MTSKDTLDGEHPTPVNGPSASQFSVVDKNFDKKTPKFDMKSEEYITYRFRHYPARTAQAAIDYSINNNKSRENLKIIIKDLLEHYSPANDLAGENAIDFEALDDTAEVLKDFGMDSLALMEIAFFIEETFALRIETEKIMNIVTLKDVLDMVEQTAKEQDGVVWPKVTLGKPVPGDAARAFKKYEIGWVPNPENTTAFVDCYTPNKDVPVIDMNDPETIKKLEKAGKEGKLDDAEAYQAFIKKEFSPKEGEPKKKKRKYTKRSDYWKKKQKKGK